jgi:hypothetical protein
VCCAAGSSTLQCDCQFNSRNVQQHYTKYITDGNNVLLRCVLAGVCAALCVIAACYFTAVLCHTTTATTLKQCV